ncbi:hypothetical protein RF11_04664 [Thelohanellus kitauei]|uniref:Uncharacterized protein n=1 Tax=Thelohanellus kitauei TaxID=669202 RepID=A0A0C2MHY4_THEKT|nr:hypothetical protein RF11_04664 [Thelohanellus kitauei]
MNNDRLFNKWNLFHDDKPIIIDHFIPIKYVIFGFSTLNNLFFYADNQFKIFSIEKYEAHSSIIPSRLDASCIIKNWFVFILTFPRLLFQPCTTDTVPYTVEFQLCTLMFARFRVLSDSLCINLHPILLDIYLCGINLTFAGSLVVHN